jgi:hypothetical protein
VQAEKVTPELLDEVPPLGRRLFRFWPVASPLQGDDGPALTQPLL